MADNYVCEFCPKEATAFSLSLGKKVQICGEHVAKMIDKALPIFPIEAFNFVHEHNDFPEFTRRRDIRLKGETYLTRLMNSVKEEKGRILQDLATNQTMVTQVIQQTYEAMNSRIEDRYTEVMSRLIELNGEFEVFTQSLETRMSDSMKLIQQAKTSYIPGLLQLRIRSQSLEVARAVMGSYVCKEDSVDSLISVFLDPAEDKKRVSVYTTAIEKILRNPQRDTIEEAAYLSSLLVKMGVADGSQLHDQTTTLQKRTDLRSELSLCLLLNKDPGTVIRAIAGEEVADQSDETALRRHISQYTEGKQLMEQAHYIEAESVLVQVEHFLTLHFPASHMRTCVHASLARLYHKLQMQEVEQYYRSLFNNP